MNLDDKSLFLDAMEDVQPLKRATDVHWRNWLESPPVRCRARRKRSRRFRPGRVYSLRARPEAFSFSMRPHSSAMNAPASAGLVPPRWMLETTVRLASGMPT